MLLRNIQEWTLLLIVIGFISLMSNWVGYDIMPLSALPGMLILIAICIAGFILSAVIPINFPSVAYISLIGVIVSLPWTPGSEYVVKYTSEVQLLALTTPILAYAGIAIGRSWTDFKELGWRAIVVSSLVILGSFLASAVIADIVLRFQGVI